MVMLISSGGTESDVKRLHLKWIGQRKFDGVLCVAYCLDTFRLEGRNGTDLTKRFPNIANEMMKNCKGIFVGEIVCDTFKHTCSRAKTENPLKSKLLVDEYPAKFMVFDLINPLHYADRFLTLKKCFRNKLNFVEVVESSFDLMGLWEQAKKENWEGIILKNPLGRYEDKRTKSQLKVKCVKSRDIDFVRFEENTAGIKCFSDNDFFKIQVTGSQSVPVRDMIENTGSCQIEVEYLEEFESGKLRMPVFKEMKTPILQVSSQQTLF